MWGFGVIQTLSLMQLYYISHDEIMPTINYNQIYLQLPIVWIKIPMKYPEQLDIHTHNDR